MKTLILTRDNLVESDYNNTFKIDFNPTLDTTDMQLAFVNSQLYYSFFNIDGNLYQNNKISYYWIDGQKYDITIEDGGFESTDIYNYIVVEMIKNKQYTLQIEHTMILRHVLIVIYKTFVWPLRY